MAAHTCQLFVTLGLRHSDRARLFGYAAKITDFCGAQTEPDLATSGAARLPTWGAATITNFCGFGCGNNCRLGVRRDCRLWVRRGCRLGVRRLPTWGAARLPTLGAAAADLGFGTKQWPSSVIDSFTSQTSPWDGASCFLIHVTSQTFTFLHSPYKCSRRHVT